VYNRDTHNLDKKMTVTATIRRNPEFELASWLAVSKQAYEECAKSQRLAQELEEMVGSQDDLQEFVAIANDRAQEYWGGKAKEADEEMAQLYKVAGDFDPNFDWDAATSTTGLVRPTEGQLRQYLGINHDGSPWGD
jgi:hypothetical protein